MNIRHGVRKERSAAGALTIEQLLSSPQDLNSLCEQIKNNNGQILYWVHPLFIKNNLDKYYEGSWFKNVYRKLMAEKIGLEEEEITKQMILDEYEQFLSQTLKFIKQQKCPLFVAVGRDYLEEVRDFLSSNQVEAVLIETLNSFPNPLGLEWIDFFKNGKAYEYEDWRYLQAILQEQLGVEKVELIGEMAQIGENKSAKGCVSGTQSGLEKAVKFAAIVMILQ